MWWDLVGHGPHVNLLKDVDARDDKEDAGTSSSSGEESTKTEDHRSFIFLHSVTSNLFILASDSYLNNLDHDIEGEGEGGKDEKQGADGEEERADPRPLLAHWGVESEERIVNGYLRNTLNVTISNQTWLSVKRNQATPE